MTRKYGDIIELDRIYLIISNINHQIKQCKICIEDDYDYCRECWWLDVIRDTLEYLADRLKLENETIDKFKEK